MFESSVRNRLPTECQKIEDAMVAVAQEPRSDHDVGDARCSDRDKPLQILRVVLEIGVLDGDEIASGARDARAQAPRPCPDSPRAAAGRPRGAGARAASTIDALSSLERSSTTMICSCSSGAWMASTASIHDSTVRASLKHGITMLRVAPALLVFDDMVLE